MGTRLLITGYPGWLTSRFLDTLEDYPEQFSSIRCLVRPDRIQGIFGVRWQCVPGDLNDPVSLREAVKECDVILHAAGIIHVKKVDDFYRINRDGTRHLLEAAVNAGVSKMVYISSNAAQGFCAGKGYELDESAPCRPVGHYAKSKREAEEVVESYSGSGKIKTVILRPAMFYGPPVPSRHVDIYKRIQKGSFPVFGTGDYLRSVTYIDNLVQAIHLSFTKKKADGNTYLITDREIPTLNQLVLAMGDALGVSVRLIKLPKGLAMLAEHLDNIIESTGCYWMLPHIVGESCKNIGYKIDRAENDLGYNPGMDYRRGMKKAVQWCFDRDSLKR